MLYNDDLWMNGGVNLDRNRRPLSNSMHVLSNQKQNFNVENQCMH